MTGHVAPTASGADRASLVRFGPTWSKSTSISSTTSTTPSIPAENAAAVQTKVSFYFCPADRQGMWMPVYPRSRGNYMLNWGYCDETQTQPAGYKIGPFSANRQSSCATIRDGLSNTMFMGEILQAINDTDWDYRGDFFNTGLGAYRVHDPVHAEFGRRCHDLLGTTPDEPAPCQWTGTVYMAAHAVIREA